MSSDAGIAVLAWAPGRSNGVLVERWRELGLRAALLRPPEALATLREGDTALVRLDVLRTLDGIEPGLEAVGELSERGVRVLNNSAALLRAHDKLETVRALGAAGIRTPSFVHVPGPASTSGTLAPAPEVEALEPPVVVKPRFGSWGRDVTLCTTRPALRRCLERARSKLWFQRHGALIQQFVPSGGVDLRILVAGGTVVGRAERTARLGEWRTNVSLGGTVRAAPREPEAEELAVAASDAIGTDLVGVDLLRAPGAWVVIELNGAVDFDANYSLESSDVFADVAGGLGLLDSPDQPAGAADLGRPPRPDPES